MGEGGEGGAAVFVGEYGRGRPEFGFRVSVSLFKMWEGRADWRGAALSGAGWLGHAQASSKGLGVRVSFPDVHWWPFLGQRGRIQPCQGGQCFVQRSILPFHT